MVLMVFPIERSVHLMKNFQVLLSKTVVYFYDAHLFVDEATLEKYFSQFGQVFRTLHLADPVPPGPNSTSQAVILNKVGILTRHSPFSSLLSLLVMNP